ncbi:MAG: hypothetical protein ACRBDI_07465 [Alphaproteobacteria bacterium]
MRALIACLMCLGLSIPAMAQGYPLPVPTVYLSMGKTYNDFDPATSTIRGSDARYLNALFELTDEAVRARYFMMNSYTMEDHAKHFEGTYKKTIEMVMAGMSEISPPSDTLKEVEVLITEAIFAQYQFFSEMDEKYKGQVGVRLDWRSEVGNENIQMSHKKLLDAHALLTTTYFTENERNLQAFYDHLCALDFI